MDNSPYLDKPFVPLAVALPRMLARIERDCRLRARKKGAGLEIRAELVRSLLGPSHNFASFHISG